MNTINVFEFQEDQNQQTGSLDNISIGVSSSVVSDNMELVPDKGFSFMSFSTTIESKGNTKAINTSKAEVEAVLETNLQYWRREKQHCSVGNFESVNFDKIVELGDAAIPLIRREMEKGPTPLVRVLDILYPDVMEYNGLTTIEEACNLWLPLLKMI